MKVFPDANFLVAAGLRPTGDYRKVLELSQDEFFTSEHILAEVSKNLERLQREPLPFILSLRRFITVTNKFDILPVGVPLQGSGDRQALAEAIGSGCDLFVTSDTEVSAIFGQKFKGVFIEKSSAYARRILSQCQDLA